MKNVPSRLAIALSATIGFGMLAFALAPEPLKAASPTRPDIRALPYPFAQMVSFSDDADELKPWHEASIHRVFNQEIGLPVTDSLWPHGSNRLSTLLLGPGRPNRTPSGIDGMPTYALLLREWHRGNIDQFHGWQEDSTYQLRNDFQPAVSLSSGQADIALPPTDPVIADEQRQNVRLYLTAEPPADLTVTLSDTTGRSLSYGPEQVVRGRNVQAKRGANGVIVEFMIPTEGDRLDRLALDAGRIDHVTLTAPSCGQGCAVAVTRIERDDFSRATVASELPTLENWNVRPALLTSHGGNTLAQDFGVSGRFYEVPRTPGTIFSDASVVVHREAKATEATSHAYHADLLKRLGVEGVWSYFPADPAHYFGLLKSDAKLPLPPLTNTYPGFYNVPRSTVGTFDRSSVEAFAEDIRRVLPGLSLEERRALYCGVNCDSAQGDALALLLASSVEMIRSGTDVRHFWYTHFGSRGSEFDHTIANPVTLEITNWMRKLANLAYDFDGKVPAAQRVWSPPASTWIRYQELHAAIANHVSVLADGVTVSIEPWLDPVTGRIMPDPMAGSRDLHGLTLYVQDSEHAHVIVGNREIHTFTRNPPDESGRPSITIVDDNTPSALLDHVALREKGSLSVESGVMAERDPANGDPEESRILSLTAGSDGNAELMVHPSRLEFWNTSHLALAFRKLAPGSFGGRHSSGTAEIDFVMDNGDVVSINEEDPADQPTPGSSHWIIPRAQTGQDWHYETLDTASLIWPRKVDTEGQKWARPPLPLGKVRYVRITLEGATPGTKIELSGIRALRPNPNGESADGSKLVAGRVTLNGRSGIPNVKVRAVSVSGEVMKTFTDQDGMYLLPHRPKGDILAISAQLNGQYCTIAQGRRIEIAKNEAELDIGVDTCQQIVSSTEPEFETSRIQ